MPRTVTQNRFGFRSKSVRSCTSAQSALPSKPVTIESNVKEVLEEEEPHTKSLEQVYVYRVAELSRSIYRSDLQIDKLLRIAPGAKLPGYAYKEKMKKSQEFTKRLKTALQKLVEERDSFTEQCTHIEKKLVALSNTNEKKCTEMRSEFKNVNLKCEMAEKECISLKNLNKKIESSLKETKTYLTEETNKLKDSMEMIKGLQKRMKEVEVNLSASEDLNAEKDSSIVELTASYETLRLDQRKLQDEFQMLERNHANQLNDLKALKTKEIEKMKNECEEKAIAMDKERDQSNSKVSELTSEKVDLETQCSSLRSEMLEVKESLSAALDEVKLMTMERGRLEGETATLKEQLDIKSRDLTKVLDNFNTNQTITAQRMEETRLEKLQMQNEKKDLMDKFSMIELKLSDSNTSLVSMEKKWEQSQRDLKGTQSKLNNTENELIATVENLNSTSLDLNATNSELDSTAAELKCCEEKVSQLDKELVGLKESTEKEQSELTATLEELKDRHTELKANSSATISSLSSELDSLKVIKVDLESRLASQKSEIHTFKQNSGESQQELLIKLAALTSESDTLRRALGDKHELMEAMKASKKEIDSLAKKLSESEETRRKLHNTIQELKGNVRVMTRLRPFLKSENSEAHLGTSLTCSADKKSISLSGVGPRGDSSPSFTFDHVWDMKSNQENVFDEVSQLVQSALDGYNVCLFAYGQTNSGKTYTMQGDLSRDGKGIIPRSIAKVMQVSEAMADHGWRYTMKVSFLEIYNETVKDLLKPSSGSDGKGLTISRDTDGRTLVRGLHYHPVTEIREIDSLMETAAKHRATSCTRMNTQSSRSHSVFTLHLEGVNEKMGVSLKGALNLCDLAGSERVKRSQVEGVKLKEVAAINKSLSALSTVFMKIGSSSTHVPFRDSKLTYLLQDCLSNDGKALMIVNLSPTQSSSGESLCSLRFASQVNKCELGQATRVIKKLDDDSTPGGLELSTSQLSKSQDSRLRSSRRSIRRNTSTRF